MAQVKDRDLVEESSIATGSKLLILVTGNKGGVGKTTMARGIVDILFSRGVNYQAYDCDLDSSQLFRYYEKVGNGVGQLDISGEVGQNQLINEMDRQIHPVVILDLPAGGAKLLANLNFEVNLLAEAAEMGYTVTVVDVISPIKDSVNAVRLSSNLVGSSAKHIIVKNLFWGNEEDFTLFDGSKMVKPEFLESGGIELNMPKLSAQTYSLIDRYSLPFRTAVADPERLPRAERSRVNQWLRLLEEQVELADKFLGV
jgi:hypothetical protein